MATNRPLRELLDERRLREDLFYRLSGMELLLPPLRARGRDIVELAEHFLAINAEGRPLRLASDATSALLTYRWPGNVRELERVIQTVIALADDDEIRLADLPPHVAGTVNDTLVPAAEAHLTVRQFSARYIERVLRDCDGNQTEACRRLGISHHTLKARLRELDGVRRGRRAA